MTSQTPPRRASGERLTAQPFSPSPEPTSAVPAARQARAHVSGLRPAPKNPVIFDPERHCGAKTSPFAGEHLCKLRKGAGTDHKGVGHCRLHGGTSPNQRKAAAAEVAQLALARLGRPRAVAPQRALLETVWEAAGNVAFLREQAASLGVDLTLRASEIAVQRSSGEVAMAGETHEYAGHTVTIREDVRAIVKLYGEWCDRLAKYAKAAVEAGIAEREVRLAESQGALIARVFEATFARLGLSPEKLELARTIASSELRLVAAANPERN